MAKKKKKKSGLTVDFSGVETNVLVPEGDYRSKVAEVSQEVAEKSGNEYLKWKFVTIDEDKKLNNKSIFYNTSLQPQALWNLKNLLECLGVDVPDDEMELDLPELVDLEVMLSIEHETYDGKKRPRVVDFSPLVDNEEEVEAVDDEEEEEEEEEESEVYSTEEVEEMDEDDLANVVKAHDLKVNLKKAKTLKKKRALVIDALEEAELLED